MQILPYSIAAPRPAPISGQNILPADCQTVRLEEEEEEWKEEEEEKEEY